MPRRPVETFHLSKIASSLEAQNQAIGLLLMRVETARSLSADADLSALQLKELLGQIAKEAAIVRAAIWPEDG